MSDATSHLRLPYILAGQAQKHVTHNEALRLLDALVQLAVLDRDLAAPPGSPADGARYIVASGGSGAWAGWDLNIAYWVDGAWTKLVPRAGWLAWVADESLLLAFDGAAWQPFGQPTEVSDAVFSLVDNADPPKRAMFDLSGISAGQTRTFTLANTSSEIAILAGTQTFTGNKTFSGTLTASGATATIGTATGTATYGLGTGATTTGLTKTVNVGTGGASGSTTVVNIGSATAGAGGTTVVNTPTVTFANAVTQVGMPQANLTAQLLGLGGAAADASNRLSINTPAVLMNHAGASIDLTVNKSAAGNDASLSFKTAFSVRAILGLLADNDLHIKVSPDGSTFYDALVIDRNTGKASLLAGLRCLPIASDPVSPADGDIWYNGTGARLKARIDGRTMTLGDDEVPSLVPDAGRYFTANTTPGTTTTTLAGAADRINIYPFIPKFDFTADQLGINVTTAAASSNAKIVVYDSDIDGRPDQRITETGNLDCSSTGAKTATVSIAFKKGKQYWLGVRTSSTQTISAFQPYTSPNLDMAAIATTQTKTLQRTLAFATAAPAAWAYVASEAATTSAPAIWLRVA